MRIASKALVTAGAVATVAASFTGIASAGTPTTQQVSSFTGVDNWTVDGGASSLLVECTENNGAGDYRWAAAAVAGAQWVWDKEGQYCKGPRTDGTYAVTNAAPGTHTFTTTVTLNGAPVSGSVQVAADDQATVVVNGTSFGSTPSDHKTSASFDVTSALHVGTNTVSISAVNGDNPASCATNTCNPAGLTAAVKATYKVKK